MYYAIFNISNNHDQQSWLMTNVFPFPNTLWHTTPIDFAADFSANPSLARIFLSDVSLAVIVVASYLVNRVSMLMSVSIPW